mgnify:CR=1 FL=1
MSEQTYSEGWVLAWSFAFVVPNMAWQHRDGRLTGNPDRTTDWRDSGWFADPRMKPVPDKPAPPIEDGWWLMRHRSDTVTGAVWEQRGGRWMTEDGACCSALTVERFVPVFRLTDEQAALLREQIGGEQR